MFLLARAAVGRSLGFVARENVTTGPSLTTYTNEEDRPRDAASFPFVSLPDIPPV